MPRRERKFWPPVTKHRHILGDVRPVMHGIKEISALYLYESSICRDDEPVDEPVVRIVAAIGACTGIRCTICGEFVDWEEPPAEAYARLMGHYPRKGSDHAYSK